jgi:CHAT domain-containing protein
MIRILQCLLGVLLCTAIAGCARPPAGDFVTATGRGDEPALDLGSDAAHEPCTLQRNGREADIYCGSYLPPAGHVSVPPQATDPEMAVTASLWRSTFDRRFRCGAPAATQVRGNPGATLQCTHLQRGWQQVVLATRINGTLYIADAIKPAQSVLAQAIGVMAGQLPAVPAVKDDVSGLTLQRQAEQAINSDGVDAIARVDELMTRGAQENRRGNFAAAESAYRAAVTLQERALGHDNPALAVPLARQALQLSNQERYGDSAPVFARAERLAAARDQLDPSAAPSVAYLEALDRLNRDHPQEALALLDQAERGFMAVVPPDALAPPRRNLGLTGVEQMAAAVATADLFSDQSTRDSINGLIETRRYRAIALQALGRTQDAETALAAARSLYAGRDPRLVARYYRTLGMTNAAGGGLADLSQAVDLFTRAEPGSQPLGETQLLSTARMVAAGNDAAALPLCRDAARTLQELKTGVATDLVMPCLHALASEAQRHPAAAQPVYAEMFSLSQLARGSVTARQIALATARLAESARDPHVADALRDRDRTTDRLDVLYRQRAELAANKDTGAATGAALAKLDADIHAAQQAVTDAGQALQAVAPNFAGLVQETVAADKVLATLRPDEALAVIVLGQDEGWTFLMKNGQMAVGRIEGGARRVDALVRAFRASMEPGSNNLPPPFDAAAALGLYQSVLGPVANQMAGTRTLIVAPTGSLLSIPFGALLSGPADPDHLGQAPFLIRQMAVTHVPSVASFVNLRQAEQVIRARQPWFGFGDFHPPTLRQALATFPVESCGDSARAIADLPPLPGTHEQLEIARRLFNASPQDELLGSAFTAQQVQAAALTDDRVLHFATHAVLPDQLRCQPEAAILTSVPPNAPSAAGAMLTASDVQRMKLDAELVILAACNTGGNGSGAAESLSGLARAFFFAGARALLVTHWDANERALTYETALFLQTMTRQGNVDLPNALAVAQRRMLDEATGSLAVQAHPHYWAVAALIGGVGSRTGVVRQAATGGGRPGG